jgi:hypothetical protein
MDRLPVAIPGGTRPRCGSRWPRPDTGRGGHRAMGRPPADAMGRPPADAMARPRPGPVRPSGPVRQPSAWPSSASTTTDCDDGRVGGWRCRTAAGSRPGFRAARTTRCCCNGRAAPGTAARRRPSRSRTPREDCSPPIRRPKMIRRLPVSCPPCWIYPFIHYWNSSFRERFRHEKRQTVTSGPTVPLDGR